MTYFKSSHKITCSDHQIYWIYEGKHIIWVYPICKMMKFEVVLLQFYLHY